MKTALWIIVAPSMFAFALAGCGQDEPKAPENATGSAPSEVSTGAATAQTTTDTAAPVGNSSSVIGDASAPQVSASGGPENSPPDVPATLSDAQILQITHVANVGEIEQAKLAQTKAKDARVKSLAAMMIKDHKDADTKGAALAKKASFNPATSSVASSLEGDAQSATDNLKSQTGADFDKSYVDAQVKEHQAVLDTIDQKLAPAAQNPDLKAYLTAVRPKIAMHLQHAQDLQKKMTK